MKFIPVQEQADQILKTFSPEELMDLFTELEFIKMIYNEEEDLKELYTYCSTEEERKETRLYVIALSLHKIAKNYGRKFKKIADKYPAFDILCQKIADITNRESNVTKSSG